jgi:hypothetical protein
VLLFQLPSSLGELVTARLRVPPCCSVAGSTRVQPTVGSEFGSTEGPVLGVPGAHAVSASKPALSTATTANATGFCIWGKNDKGTNKDLGYTYNSLAGGLKTVTGTAATDNICPA